MRRGPQLAQAIVDSAGVRRRLVTRFLPGEFAADHRNRALVGPDRLGAAAARRVFALRAHLNDAHRRRLVVDRGAVGALYEARPALAGLEGLSEAENVAAARELDRVQARSP